MNGQKGAGAGGGGGGAAAPQGDPGGGGGGGYALGNASWFAGAGTDALSVGGLGLAGRHRSARARPTCSARRTGKAARPAAGERGHGHECRRTAEAVARTQLVAGTGHHDRRRCSPAEGHQRRRLRRERRQRRRAVVVRAERSCSKLRSSKSTPKPPSPRTASRGRPKWQRGQQRPGPREDDRVRNRQLTDVPGHGGWQRRRWQCAGRNETAAHADLRHVRRLRRRWVDRLHSRQHAERIADAEPVGVVAPRLRRPTPFSAPPTFTDQG